MQLLALPITTVELARLQVLTLPHHLLDLPGGLEPGQLLVGMDEDGAHWGLTVVGIRFTADATHYVFVVGAPIAPAAVDALRPDRPAPGLLPGDVAVELRVLAASRLGLLSA